MDPILLRVLFPDYRPPHEIVQQTCDDLLKSIRPVAPEVVDAARKALDEGYSMGPALARAIRAWGERIRSDEHETQNKLEARLETQGKQLAQQAKDIQAAKKDLNEVETQSVKLKQIIALHVETIRDQRNLLAKQYEQLARLSGLPKDE